MIIILVFCVLVVLLYTATILILYIGYIKIKQFKEKVDYIANEFLISVIIPVKNEEEHLPELIEGLKDQSIDSSCFEVIFIDDTSIDHSSSIISERIANFENFQLIRQVQGKSGKKEALISGIQQAKGKLIVTTDADCTHPIHWLKTIRAFYFQYRPKLIIAPVIMTGKRVFQKLQCLEFFSLIASGAGAAGLKRPIMCNGANMAYEKNKFLEFEDAMNIKESSGDDVFLLHSFKKKYPKDIGYLRCQDAIVFTEAENTLKQFVKQRTRWASKSTSYRDSDTVYVTLLVFLSNFIILTLFAFSLYNDEFIRKFIIDFLFLFFTGRYFKINRLLLFYPLLMVLYPFYIVFIAIFGIFINLIAQFSK
jgi:biofilm PGA synthesis N-glycosyltransferase PgaC